MSKKGILIPAYNEAENISETLEGILEYTDNVIVVNDGSIDNTEEIVSGYPVILINNETNIGLAQTVAKGFSYMLGKGYEYGIKMDGDGQMDPSMIPTFFDQFENAKGVDIFCATFNEDIPWMIRKDMAIYSWIYKIATGIQTTDLLSEYRGYNRRAMEFLSTNTRDDGYGSPLMIIDLHRGGYKSKELIGGVSYTNKEFRALPIDAQIGLRKAFVSKVYNHEGYLPKIVSVASIPFWAGLLIFNCTVQPKYHSFLPKRVMR